MVAGRKPTSQSWVQGSEAPGKQSADSGKTEQPQAPSFCCRFFSSFFLQRSLFLPSKVHRQLWNRDSPQLAPPLPHSPLKASLPAFQTCVHATLPRLPGLMQACRWSSFGRAGANGEGLAWPRWKVMETPPGKETLSFLEIQTPEQPSLALLFRKHFHLSPPSGDGFECV